MKTTTIILRVVWEEAPYLDPPELWSWGCGMDFAEGEGVEVVAWWRGMDFVEGEVVALPALAQALMDECDSLRRQLDNALRDQQTERR